MKQHNQQSIFLLHLFLILIITQVIPFSHCCHADERNALLTFKSFLTDPLDSLLSWQVGKNCCYWEGIHCSKESLHVVSVDLEYNHLNGEISPSLFNLNHLQYLDLSRNNFNSIPYEFANLKHLTHLYLRNSGFSGSITTQFANLFSLRYLDISCLDFDGSSNCSVSSTDTSWLRGLANLKELRMRGIDLNSPNPIQLGNLTSLSVLYLIDCQLQAGSLPHLPPQLENIYVSDNPDLDINLSLISNASLLNSLHASNCSIQGSLPTSITNLSQLEYLDLNRNNITGQIPSSMLSNLKNLKDLRLSLNNLQGPIPESICEILSLELLYLGRNKLTETIPNCIWKLENLKILDVSENSIEGTVPLISFINTSSLSDIFLSSNRITVEINHQLNPSALPSNKLQQLKYLLLDSCNIKGYIPGYFCNLTNLEILNLYNNSIIGTIPSCLSKLENLVSLDLSSNNLQGTMPHSLLFSNMTSLIILDLSSNNLRGHLPIPPQQCGVFDLSKNKFTGEISTEVGEKLSNTQYVSLSDNKLSGTIPSSICSNESTAMNQLKYLDLSMKKLKYLDLSMNQLRGTLPYSLQYCRSLISLSLGYNKLSGSIPSFIGSLHNLKILYLRSNKLNGLIPKEIAHLHQLQILDLSTNNLSGPIPVEIGYLEMLTSRPNNRSLIQGKLSSREYIGLQLQMVIKGIMIHVERLYNDNAEIDLSCNNLEGNIPEELCLLKGLPMLNLSHNCLSGKIPMRVDNMTGLESLDLSFNKLSGDIPQSLASMDFLEKLNLSYNNLSGRIPEGFHFQTLSGDNGSAYIGNPLLCEDPMSNICPANARVQNDEDDDDEDASEKWLLCGTIFLGFGVGFWGLFLVLLLKKEKWGFVYWRAVETVAVRIVDCIR